MPNEAKITNEVSNLEIEKAELEGSAFFVFNLFIC